MEIYIACTHFKRYFVELYKMSVFFISLISLEKTTGEGLYMCAAPGAQQAPPASKASM